MHRLALLKEENTTPIDMEKSWVYYNILLVAVQEETVLVGYSVSEQTTSDLLVGFEEAGILGVTDIWEHWRELWLVDLGDFNNVLWLLVYKLEKGQRIISHVLPWTWKRQTFYLHFILNLK